MEKKLNLFYTTCLYRANSGLSACWVISVGGTSRPTVPCDALGKTVGLTKANSKSCPNSWQSSRPQILIARIRAAIGGHPRKFGPSHEMVLKPSRLLQACVLTGLGLASGLGFWSGFCRMSSVNPHKT